MEIRRVIEGKDINGVVKNKNEGWSSVWSSLSLSPAALREFSEHVQILIIALCQRGRAHILVYSQRYMHTHKPYTTVWFQIFLLSFKMTHL